MSYQAPFYAYQPVAPPVIPQAFPIVSTIHQTCDAASWEQSIPFATHPLSFSPPHHNIPYQQSDVDSPDFWGPISSPPISAISASAMAPNCSTSWTGQDEPSEDEIPIQSITRCRSGYQCQVPVGDTSRPCGHVFSRRDRALTHVRVHFGMRPYNCQGTCGVRGWSVPRLSVPTPRVADPDPFLLSSATSLSFPPPISERTSVQPVRFAPNGQ